MADLRDAWHGLGRTHGAHLARRTPAPRGECSECDAARVRAEARRATLEALIRWEVRR